MKNTSKLILFLFVFVSYNCKAQRITDATYINFYNVVSPKLNEITLYKTQFYNQNFLNFYNEILSKNLTVQKISTDGKMANSKLHYIIKLYFSDSGVRSFSADNKYQYPVVIITFQNQIPDSTTNLVKQNQAHWNASLLNEFSNMIIESIEFGGTNGYNNPDRTPR